MLKQYSLVVEKSLFFIARIVCFFWNLFGIILILSLIGLIIFAIYEVDWGFIGWFAILPLVFRQFPWVHCQFSRPEEVDL